MELIISLLVSMLIAFVAHEGANYANRRVRRLNLSPNWFAFIGFLLGIPGLVILLIYTLFKYMIKK